MSQVNLPAQEYVIDMSVGGPGGGVGLRQSQSLMVLIGGDFGIVWGEAPADGQGYLDIRLNTVDAPIMRMRLGASFGRDKGTPFEKFFVDWPLIAGKKMALLIGERCNFSIDSGIWSSLIGTGIPVAPGLSGSFLEGWTIVAVPDPALGSHAIHTVPSGATLLVYGVAVSMLASAAGGIRSFGLKSVGADGISLAISINPDLGHTATVNRRYFFETGATPNTTLPGSGVDIPTAEGSPIFLQLNQVPMVISGGGTLQTTSGSGTPLQAGDQVSRMRILGRLL